MELYLLLAQIEDQMGGKEFGGSPMELGSLFELLVGLSSFLEDWVDCLVARNYFFRDKEGFEMEWF